MAPSHLTFNNTEDQYEGLTTCRLKQPTKTLYYFGQKHIPF